MKNLRGNPFIDEKKWTISWPCLRQRPISPFVLVLILLKIIARRFLPDEHHHQLIWMRTFFLFVVFLLPTSKIIFHWLISVHVYWFILEYSMRIILLNKSDQWWKTDLFSKMSWKRKRKTKDFGSVGVFFFFVFVFNRKKKSTNWSCSCLRPNEKINERVIPDLRHRSIIKSQANWSDSKNFIWCKDLGSQKNPLRKISSIFNYKLSFPDDQHLNDLIILKKMVLRVISFERFSTESAVDDEFHSSFKTFTDFSSNKYQHRCVFIC